MHIYYIGQLSEGGTCLARMQTLQNFGHEITSFDVTPWTSGGNRLLRSMAHRSNFGPNVWGLNQALVNHSHSVGSVDLVWVDKGRWIYPQTLDTLRKETQGRLLHYTPDPQIFFHKSRYFQRGIPRYDLMATTKPFECDSYRSLGVKDLLFVLQGYDRRFAEYEPESQDHYAWASDVCFVGHYERHYAERLKAASQATDRLRVWGNKWPAYAKRRAWARKHISGSGAWGDDYLRALSHAKIALGLLSKWIPETTTTRTFEIPALGTFMLAERTEDHLSLFEEGKEAEFFGDDEEMKDKIRFYLANDPARKKIAAAGRERCLKSGYSSVEQLKGILDQISAGNGRQ
jgi:spore maturation protein CgeB